MSREEKGMVIAIENREHDVNVCVCMHATLVLRQSDGCELTFTKEDFFAQTLVVTSAGIKTQVSKFGQIWDSF